MASFQEFQGTKKYTVALKRMFCFGLCGNQPGNGQLFVMRTQTWIKRKQKHSEDI